ncbi:MAG: glycosyltransferase [Chlamydiales bacterium]|nr:glycosyltransferase [Chlamydiales bacterium]
MKKTISLLLLFLLPIFGVISAQKELPEKKRVCLNMIIKDERDVIERCLGSVKNIIDYWVIVDTGSTDGTQEIVKKFMKDIPGELHERKWVDFAHNRNEALQLAKGKADYLLLIDADEILQYSKDFSLPSLDKDYYHITVRQLGAADVKRTGLVNNHLNWKWRGVLHEVIETPEAKTYGLLNGVINICNAAVGARSKIPQKEKYLKDAKVLEKALKTEPDNSRYAYFLGQSYLAADEYKLAKLAFEKRVTMQSPDPEETYRSFYSLGLAQEKLEELDPAIESFFKAYKCRPTRAEPLFRIATIYRKKGNFLLGYLLSKYALTIPYPTYDVCVEYMTYDYALLIEFANCTLLSGKFQEGLQACMQLLANPNLPAEIRPHVIANCELAKKNLGIRHD